MITTAATACNIQLMVEMIITSHTDMAYVEHKSSRHATAPRYQSVDRCWVCLCRTLSL